jgi:hypothetical protein
MIPGGKLLPGYKMEEYFMEEPVFVLKLYQKGKKKQ